ncbi:MAG: hypothetical protein CUN53_03600 [Phototrophicales bacterium]|nr:MAG: hypothetical protein CUN53_03600 [Phototrophicales bacterium]
MSPTTFLSRLAALLLIFGAMFGAVGGLRSPSTLAQSATPGAIVYIVQTGDTLSSIAARFNVPLARLAAGNLLAEDAALPAGMMLIIPVGVSPSPFPTNTSAPSATPMATSASIITPQMVTPIPTAAPIILPNMTAPMPGPELINDIPLAQIVSLDAETRANVRAIFARGQQLGRNPRAFSKLGDSTIESPYFLDRFDVGQGDYNLGAFAYLQPLIDYFQGSFSRQGVAVVRGLHTWSVFDPMWANDYYCEPRETMLACEFRLHNPAYLFVRLGSNDLGAPTATERNLRDVIEFSIENGVIPIMGTKGDRRDGTRANDIIRRLADEYNVPLWDYDLIAGTLPGRGVGSDGVHLTTWYAHDYTNPEAFRRGYGVHNLTALIALYQTWMVVLEADDARP